MKDFFQTRLGVESSQSDVNRLKCYSVTGKNCVLSEFSEKGRRAFKVRFKLNVVFPPLNMGLIEISRCGLGTTKTLRSFHNSMLFFYNFFDDFWICLGGDSFPERIG